MRSSWSEADLAYLAGIIDGEGCVVVGFRNKDSLGHSVYNKLSVGNTDEGLIRWMHETFGGNICRRPKRGRSQAHWVWTVSLPGHVPLAEAVLPYLKIKGPQLKLALDLVPLVRPGVKNMPQEILDRRIELISEIRALKRPWLREIELNEEG